MCRHPEPAPRGAPAPARHTRGDTSPGRATAFGLAPMVAPMVSLVVALVVTLAASASLSAPAQAATIEGAPVSPFPATRHATPSASPAPPVPPVPRFHLRCWQNGRLLFEQAVAALPADAGRSTRLQAKDGASEPVIVYETRNATCMARGLRVAR